MSAQRKLKVLFLCTANSCRSQMAEGFAKALGKDIIEPYSAGLHAFYVQPRAIEVMKEAGIDISSQTSKAMDENLLQQMDIIVTLCNHADATCPATPPDIRRIHMPVADPVGMTGTEEEVMNDFRRARDEIRAKIGQLIRDLDEQ